MSISAVTSKDTITINGRILRNFADGDTAKLDIPEMLTNVTTGKNQNSIYAYNYKGKNAKMEIRLIAGSSDDQFLNALLQSYNQNPAGFTLLTMEFDKNIGDGSGNISVIVYLGTGGTFEKQPAVVENASGETNQAVTVWNLIFANVDRSIT
jgi:hypothetical protein